MSKKEKKNASDITQEDVDRVVGSTPEDLNWPMGRKKCRKYWAKRFHVPKLKGPIINSIGIRLDVLRKERLKQARSILKPSAGEGFKVLTPRLQTHVEMKKLKEELHRIDRKEGIEESKNAKTIFYDEEHHRLFVNENGAPRRITEGDIMADYNWGIEYHPDMSMPPMVWRRVSKLLALKKAREKTFDLYNQELINIFHVNAPTTSWSLEFIKEYHQKNKKDQGFIAERMVQGFLTRLQYNKPELGLRVEPANAIEDTELKYDFKVMVPQYRRGVATEGEDLVRGEYVKQKRKIGVQLTVGHAGKNKQEKTNLGKQRLEEEKYKNLVPKLVDDIVLVSLRLPRFGKCFEKWLEAGEPAGGPEQYLNKEEELYILTEVTKNLPNMPKSKEDLEALLE